MAPGSEVCSAREPPAQVPADLVPATGSGVAPGIYYDLKNPADRGFAFDYDGTGQADHLVLYRPGAGLILVSRNPGRGNFLPVAPEGSSGRGIGGYDFKNAADRAFPFDYTGTGKQDHLVLYRSGTGRIAILKHQEGVFEPVYSQPDSGAGIGGYDLKNAADRAFAFDYDSMGKLTP